MNKIKNLFTEEIEVEEVPIKKEVMQVEIPSPVVKEEPKVEVHEPETLKREDKVRAPVFFDDKDFANLEKPKPVEKPKPKVAPAPKKETYAGRKEEKKKFAPSPIISPVYGVLDKNYHKEDITDKKEGRSGRGYTQSKNALTIDDVRKKVFGTLEDDLETTMVNHNSILFNDEPEELEVVEEPKQKDIFDELDFVEDPIELGEEEPLTRIKKNAKIDELSGLELDVTEDELLSDNFGETDSTEGNMIAEEMDKLSKSEKEEPEELDLKESELFDLIDSMYEKRDDE